MRTLEIEKKIFLGMAALFLAGLIQRALQIWMIWPQLVVAINAAPENQVMQLLPKAIMAQHPLWGIWFLQQSPPIPNIIWAATLAFTQSPHWLAIIFISLNAIFSSLAASFLILLLHRLQLPLLICLILPTFFLFGSDLLLLEYTTFGQFFYEILTMLFVVMACHAALSIATSMKTSAAYGLGACAATLALTRASFSYFWIAILLWLILIGRWRQPKLLLAYLIPILFFHGGWALKNYFIYDYWSWSTSSWGGANIQQGERNRNGFRFNEWLASQHPICGSPWHELTAEKPNYFFFMPSQWNAQLPQDVILRDEYISTKRGASAILDSKAAQLWSHCLMREFSYYWRAYPLILFEGAWRSYQIFWLPIRQFAVTQPFPLRADMAPYPEGFQWQRAFVDSWQEWEKGYSIRQAPLKLAPIDDIDYSPTKIIALPFFGSFISALNFIILHSLPILAVLVICTRVRITWPKGFSFFLLIYIYLSSLTSFVEYGENMRFRINIEPIIWILCALIIKKWREYIEIQYKTSKLLIGI